MSRRDITGGDWSKEGEIWFNGLDWEDARFLLTTRAEDPRTAEDEAHLARLRASYERATGETWD